MSLFGKMFGSGSKQPSPPESKDPRLSEFREMVKSGDLSDFYSDIGMVNQFPEYAEKVKLWVAAGADVNDEKGDHLGRPPLVSAVWSASCSSCNHPGAVKALLEAGANPDSKDHDGQTSLYFAVNEEEVEIVRLLLEAGANPNVELPCSVYHFKTSLHVAVQKNNLQIITMLLEAGANPNVKVGYSRDTDVLEYLRIQQRFSRHYDAMVALVKGALEGPVSTGRQKAAQQPTKQDMHWFVAESRDKEFRQVVIEIPGGLEAATEFGFIFLGEKFLNMMTNTEAISFVRLDNHPKPHLLVRADGGVMKFKSCPIRVAFNFCRMKSSGLVAVILDVLHSGERKQFEQVFGLDTDYVKELLQDAFTRDVLQICFAEGKGTGETSGGVFSSPALEGRFDVIAKLSMELRAILTASFSEILKYHASIPAGKRDFQRGAAEMFEKIPSGGEWVATKGK